LMALVLAGLMGVGAGSVQAQATGTPINPGKDCTTVRTCNFKKGGAFRGCVSSYSCRRCRFVRTRCRIGNAQGACRQLRCSWGS